jgi:glucosamine-6-phosphate deaminase
MYANAPISRIVRACRGWPVLLRNAPGSELLVRRSEEAANVGPDRGADAAESRCSLAEVVVVDSKAAAGALIADEIAALIRRQPDVVLGLATGSTPTPVYEALPSRLRGVDVSRVRGFALDEYVGLDPRHPETYRNVITREVVEPLGLTPELIHTPNGSREGIEHAGDDYEAAILAAGGVELQILGIGTGGHIGFNEPGSSFASQTRVKTLTAQTRSDNARFFDSIDEVPMHCVTQGLGTILRARHLVLLAFGEGKADAIAGAVEGPVTSSLPGSAIQLHPHATVVVDEAAASRLQHLDYYRYAYNNKPAWQGL